MRFLFLGVSCNTAHCLPTTLRCTVVRRIWRKISVIRVVIHVAVLGGVLSVIWVEFLVLHQKRQVFTLGWGSHYNIFLCASLSWNRFLWLYLNFHRHLCLWELFGLLFFFWQSFLCCLRLSASFFACQFDSFLFFWSFLGLYLIRFLLWPTFIGIYLYFF